MTGEKRGDMYYVECCTGNRKKSDSLSEKKVWVCVRLKGRWDRKKDVLCAEEKWRLAQAVRASINNSRQQSVYQSLRHQIASCST